MGEVGWGEIQRERKGREREREAARDKAEPVGESEMTILPLATSWSALQDGGLIGQTRKIRDAEVSPWGPLEAPLPPTAPWISLGFG